MLDQARFTEARRAFDVRDYRTAAEAFLAAAGGPGGPGNGEAYHLAGNALMKLRKYQHAATVYQHALRDTTYDKLTHVLVNLATAQAATGEYADAVATFGAALGDERYAKRYKLLQGRAGALYAMGRYDEAARDYITAAEPGNPDRGRAFNNLGLTLAAAGRADEAVDAYKAALATDGYTGKGKAAANLGLAYAALGRHSDAVAVFEAATGTYGHTLSGVAAEAYEAASAFLPRRETVEGWETGDMREVAGAPEPEADEPAVEVTVTEQQQESGFFTRTDSEMKELDREMRRVERAERNAGTNPWVRAGVVALAAVLVVGALAAVFFAGYGYPTQRQTVSAMLGAYRSGRAVTDFWVAAPAADVGKEMATIPPNFLDTTIDRVESGAFTSKVVVTVKLEKGAPLRYGVSLSREGVGWKVIGIDNEWDATGGS